MSLMDKINNQAAYTQVRMNITGTDGIGKSTFGAGAPKPIFICAEDGLRFIDTPHFERLCQEQVKENHNIKTIEALGFGKGFTESYELFARILRNLEALSVAKKMNVILLSHVQIRTFSDPEHEPYDRYELNTHKKVSSLIRSWVDFNFFANHLFTTVKSGQGFNEKARGKTFSDKRYLFTKRTAAFDAKSRLQLPERIDFNWSAFTDACKATVIPNETKNKGGQNV